MTMRILVGDARERLRELPDESVHCVVTSPPYYGLRDYGTAAWDGGDSECEHQGSKPSRKANAVATSGLEGGKSSIHMSIQFNGDCGRCGAKRIDRQIGLEPSPAEYVETLVAVFREARRVLRRDGTLWLNLGISYAGGGTIGHNDTTPEALARRAAAYGTGTGAGSAVGKQGRISRGVGDKRSSQSHQPPHAPACDIDGKEPRYSPAPDFVYPDPDGEHRDGFLSHHDRIVDTGSPLRQSALQLSPTDHDIARSDSAGAPPLLPGALVSTTHASPPHALAGPDLEATASARLTIDPTLPADVLGSAHTATCTSGSAPPASVLRIQDKDVLGLACRCGSCGFCFIRLATGALSFKPKDEMNLPHLVAMALQADGWFLRQTIIWSKPNPMPESVTDRCTKAHEYLFLLSKSERYWFDAAAIAEQAIGPAGGNITPVKGAGQDLMRTRNGLHLAQARARENGGYEIRNRRSVWTVGTQPFTKAHFATFPPALIEPCILAGCPRGGTVLDPFFGAGTTGIVADRLGRDCIGIELNPAYAEMTRARLVDDAGMFANVEFAA